VVDTGASVTLIAPSVATDLGYDLRAAAKSEVQTVSGVEVMPRVVLDRVTVGDCSVEGVRAVCYRMPDAQVRAVLGLSFLQQFRATLSIKENSLELADP
jgi:clan AA aspartic protease (TIGR02281 family)